MSRTGSGAVRWLRARRALLRVELRGLQRHPGRGLLIVALVAVPVAATVGAGTLLGITTPTPEERRQRELGRAELAVEPGPGLDLVAAAELLPDRARSQLVWTGGTSVEVPGRRLRARAVWLGPAVPDAGTAAGPGLTDGVLRLVRGAAPERLGEVALSRPLLAELGVDLGDPVSVDGQAARVTGEVADPEELRAGLVLATRAQPPAAAAARLLVGTGAAAARAAAAALERRGARVVLRADLGAPDPFASLVALVIGGVGCFEAALVVAAAFAVGMRRRRRELGLLGAEGAQVGALWQAIVLSATVLALLGVALGVAVGAGAARALHPWLDGWNGRANGAFEVSWTHVVGGALLGLVSSVAAASLPVRSATRLPIREQLGARRPRSGREGRWSAAAAAGTAAGLALVLGGRLLEGRLVGLALVLGSVLVVAGLCCAAPWLLGRLGVMGTSLPLPWRLAIRDAGRFRARNGPVVAAVLAGMAISVTVGALTASVDRLGGSTGPGLPGDGLLLEGSDAGELARAQPPGAFLDMILLVCLATGLVVVCVATALSAVESAADARALHALGAGPGVLRGLIAARACYLAFLGCVLAVPAGLVPALGLQGLANVPLEFVVPWRTLALTLTVLPLAAYACTWLGAAPGAARRTRIHGRPPRASSAPTPIGGRT